MKNLKTQSKKGFSLVELLLVLGVIAALGVTAFMIYPKVSASNNAQTEATNINTIKASVASLYSSSPDYADLDTPVAIGSKVFPDAMVNSDGTKALNSFKGEVTVKSNDDATGKSPSGVKNSSFDIVYKGVPPAVCVKLVSAVASNFYRIDVAGTPVKQTLNGKGTVKIDVLTRECEKGDSVITFTSL